MNNLEGFGFAMKGLPLQLNCYKDATVSFLKLGIFKAIVDQPETGVQAIIDSEGIFIGSETELLYNERYQYKEMPELLSWLIAQQMEMPKF